MTKYSQEQILEKLEKVRNEVKDNFVVMDKIELQNLSGSMIEKINLEPDEVFHFLEFIFQHKYVDLFKEKGIMFVDNKTSWDFLLKTDFGFLRIYDWKGGSVSIGSAYNKEISSGLQEKVKLLKRIIEDNIYEFNNFKKAESKKILEEEILDNFLDAFVSQQILLNASQEMNKIGTSLLESLILYVSFLDTALRYLIFLTRVNTRMLGKIEPDLIPLISQTDDNHISEREIFKIAKSEVNFYKNDKELLFKSLSDLYSGRNIAVHRFAVTSFQYFEIRQILEKYKDIKDVLFEAVQILEQEQIDLGVGFIKKENTSRTDDENSNKVRQIVERKINPFLSMNDVPERDAIFKEDYKRGVTPILKEILRQSSADINIPG